VLDRQNPTPKLPLTSLALLLLTYATFGWLIYDWTSDRRMWLAVAGGVTLLGVIVTYPSRSVSFGFGGFFKTDTRALILIILTSVVCVALLTWLQFFVDTIVLCTAGLLVSLDLKIRGWSKALSMVIISGWQLMGMSIGLCLHYIYTHPASNLPAYLYTDYWTQFVDRIVKSF
jgi:hypothetical protein